MSSGVVLIVLFVIVGNGFLCAEASDIERIEHLVKQWSPIIWISPEENYMPLSVEEFLDNIHFTDENGKFIQNFNPSNIFGELNSQSTYLVPRLSLDLLKGNRTSFLYGKSPSHNSVPIYAVISYCSPYNSDKDTFNNEVNTFWTTSETPSSFYVSYWMFYPYNEGKNVCFLGKVPTPVIFNTCFGRYKKMGNHIGDWEHMSVYFSGKNEPERLFLAVHDAGVYYKYDSKRRVFKYHSQIGRKGVAHIPKFPPFVRLQGGHPVLFSARGSHGLWSSPGEHDFYRVPRLTDQNGYGVPWKTWNDIVFYHLGKTALPTWMTFRGKWGNPKSKCVLFKKLGLCEYTEGPLGVLRDKQDFTCGTKFI